MSTIGRPKLYNSDLAKEICKKIATTHKGLRQLCRENDHWPCRDTIRLWTHESEEFSALYARAKEWQIEWLAEEALEISHDGSEDTIINDRGKKVCDHEWVQRSRLKVDTIKWYASKLRPKKFGDKLQVVPVLDDKELNSDKDIASKLLEQMANNK